MTRVEFFFNVGNKPQKLAELSEKAISKGRRILVYCRDAASATELERFFWTQSPLSFLPLCRVGSPLASVTPIILDWEGDQMVHDDVLVNLQETHPPFFSRFRRLIEIVGLDEQDKVKARVRYRFYRERGYEIRTFDAQGAAL